MRMSKMLVKTRKQVAAEAELPSAQLILRAGLARQVAAGIYSLTPLAHRVVRRIERVVREEMERIGGQEALLPVTQPADLWRESGRYEAIGAELARFRDRNEREMVLAMTHEEAVTDLVRAVVDSYRQLPLMVFQIQTKFRDEPRPRGGLIRLREFLMKDAYSFHTMQEDFDEYYERVVEAYRRIYKRLDLPVLVVEADTGIMGGQVAHEFMLLAPGGEDTLIVCTKCGYAANAEVAIARKDTGDAAIAPNADETPRELYTPGATTIAALCAAARCAPSQTLKAVFYAAGDDLVLALIRGDLEVNEVKLRSVLGQEVRALSHVEAEARGLAVGYTGPVGLDMAGGVRLVADDSLLTAGSLIAGANRVDYHLAGVRFGRDFSAEITSDIALARAGQPCAHCGAALEERRGIEAGNTFKLGAKYSATMGATFADERGVGGNPMIMGCYGLGITRLVACLIEQHHDADGIVWPVSVAPYRYHLLVAGNGAEARAAADTLYVALGAEITLYDDREASAGVKFKDADLLGMPLRVTVSARSLAAGGAELRLRATGETRIVPLAEVATAAETMLDMLTARHA
ncbi:MAG: Prolyl-tRNA synthetase, bacterial type [Ktedonobacterales bacterium]|jgi:prolyl-tRNA synthetase|nr:MAG: Prolyl-tRNA synthetase, bacterial type [Ktedonobacterales bacterium]